MALEITIYGKTKKAASGQTFMVYLSRLPMQDGTQLPVTVRFEEGVPKPKTTPCNIKIEKENTHLGSRKYKREDTGEEQLSWTLWVAAWSIGSEYVDHSMDGVAF